MSNFNSRTAVQQSFRLRSHDLGGRVFDGAKFQFIGILLRTVITIGSTAVLARLLVPADFGYVAMATVVTELAALFGNFGLANILIQRSQVSRRDLDTVFWATAGLGAALALVVLALSFVANIWFADPKVGELLRVLCWTFVLGGLTAVPWVVLARMMRFRTEFWIQIATVAFRTAVAIACAWEGMGAWSLVAGAFAGLAMQALLGMLVVHYWPRFRFRRELITSTWKTSSSYFLGGMLFYANSNVDLILIGRTFGAQTLGFYQGARSLTDEIRSRVAMPIQNVLFPAFASVQQDPARGREIVMRSGGLLAAIVIPLGMGVGALAPEVVAILFGERWSPMVPLLSMLAISAAMKASVTIATPIINAHDRVAEALKYQVIGTALVIVSVLVAMPYGIAAVTVAMALISPYGLAPFRFGLSLLGMGWREMWAILGPPWVASLTFCGLLLAVRPLTGPLELPSIVSLAMHGLLAGSVYLLVLLLVWPRYMDHVRFVIGKFRHR